MDRVAIDPSSGYGYGEPSQNPTLSSEVEELRAFAAAQDLNGIKSFFSTWRERQTDKERLPDNFTIVLCDAVTNNWIPVVSCLLDNGLPMSPGLFLVATQAKSYQVLQTFLDHGWDINTPMNLLIPPALAFTFDDNILLNWFLDHGANPNAQCGRDCTPLSWAVRDAPFSVIQLLFKRGGTTENGQLLHYAAMRQLADRLEVLDFLLGKGLPINNIMYQNRLEDYYRNMYSGIGTPLHFAAEKGLLDSIQLLVERGADPLIKDPTGKTALDWAEYHNHAAVVDFLRPLSIPSSTQRHDFTDEPGRHFTPVPLEDLVKKGWQVV